MGRETLSGFRERLQRSLGERTQPNSALDTWINDGYYELVSNQELSEFLEVADATVTSGDNVLPIPSDLIGVKSLVSRTDDAELLYLDPENFMQKDPDTDGDPDVWTREGNGVRIWPTPDEDKDLVMLYYETPPALENESDMTQMPSPWDRVVFLWAWYHALLDLGEFEQANLVQQKAVQASRGRRRTLNLEQKSRHERGVDVARDRSDLK